MIGTFRGHEIVVEAVELSDDEHTTDFDVASCPRADWPHNEPTFWRWVLEAFK